ncbi:MAG TPA: Gfo/Idh/MocA family oxidoreductase, partial [Kofleriaceae bacterium]|nr:Gfo/Idh/MocA family oxidoreductase [Kofleriaceae bacterium]
MTGSPLRVAVWGLGPHAEKRLLPALAAGGPVALAGVTTRDAERGARLAAAHGCRFWPAPGDMLASADVDAVLVATPIGLHAEHGRAVL